MKVNIKKASDKAVPEVNQDGNLPPNLPNFLATPGQGLARHKKPRDSFAVMRMRNQKHAIGITIPEK